MPDISRQQRAAVGLAFALVALVTLLQTMLGFQRGVPFAFSEKGSPSSYFVYEPGLFVTPLVSLSTAWLTGYWAAPRLLRLRGDSGPFLGGAAGLSAYILSDLLSLMLVFLLSLPSHPKNCCTFSQFFYYMHGPLPLRWLEVGTTAGLLGFFIGFVLPFLAPAVTLQKIVDTGSKGDHATSTIRITPFLWGYTLYAFTSGVLFIVLTATTFDQIYEVSFIFLFEILGPAWIQVLIAIIAWIVKGIRGLKEVAVPSAKLRRRLWLLAGLQISYVGPSLLYWVNRGLWIDHGDLLYDTGIFVRVLFYISNVALIVFLFRSPRASSPQNLHPSNPKREL